MADDIAVLHAEVAAIQAVLISVYRELSRGDPAMLKRFIKAFDEAETILTGLATHPDQFASSGTSIEALRIVEQIRVGVIRASDPTP